jgi:hypothetical protein
MLSPAPGAVTCPTGLLALLVGHGERRRTRRLGPCGQREPCGRPGRAVARRDQHGVGRIETDERNTMLMRRTPLAAALAVAALAVSAPAAGAVTWPSFAGVPSLLPAAALPGNAVGPCGTVSQEGQGRVSGNEASVCQGAGLAFIGPSVGQVASVMGPTIISPGFVGTVITTTGNVALP